MYRKERLYYREESPYVICREVKKKIEREREKEREREREREKSERVRKLFFNVWFQKTKNNLHSLYEFQELHEFFLVSV